MASSGLPISFIANPFIARVSATWWRYYKHSTRLHACCDSCKVGRTTMVGVTLEDVICKLHGLAVVLLLIQLLLAQSPGTERRNRRVNATCCARYHAANSGKLRRSREGTRTTMELKFPLSLAGKGSCFFMLTSEVHTSSQAWL